MAKKSRPLAVVTGASAGIGYELAKLCAKDGFDLVIAADEKEIEKAADTLRAFDADVTSVFADLATIKGVDKLYDGINGRDVDALLANAGHGLGKGFLIRISRKPVMSSIPTSRAPSTSSRRSAVTCASAARAVS